jgi:hypothetical protein
MQGKEIKMGVHFFLFLDLKRSLRNVLQKIHFFYDT